MINGKKYIDEIDSGNPLREHQTEILSNSQQMIGPGSDARRCFFSKVVGKIFKFFGSRRQGSRNKNYWNCYADDAIGAAFFVSI